MSNAILCACALCDDDVSCIDVTQRLETGELVHDACAHDIGTRCEGDCGSVVLEPFAEREWVSLGHRKGYICRACAAAEREVLLEKAEALDEARKQYAAWWKCVFDDGHKTTDAEAMPLYEAWSRHIRGEAKRG